MVVVSLDTLCCFIIGTWEGSLVGSSLGLPLRSPLGMALVNTCGFLILYPNPVSVICFLIGTLFVVILRNPYGYLPGSLDGMLPGALLGNWNESLLGKFPVSLMIVNLGLQFVSKMNSYW